MLTEFLIKKVIRRKAPLMVVHHLGPAVDQLTGVLVSRWSLWLLILLVLFKILVNRPVVRGIQVKCREGSSGTLRRKKVNKMASGRRKTRWCQKKMELVRSVTCPSQALDFIFLSALVTFVPLWWKQLIKENSKAKRLPWLTVSWDSFYNCSVLVIEQNSTDSHPKIKHNPKIWS